MTTFKHILKRFCEIEGVPVPRRLRRYRAILAANGTRVVASPDNYHGKPRQDVVLVLGDDPRKPWVGRLIVPFAFAAGNATIEAAIVHYFDDAAGAQVNGLPGVRALRQQAYNVVPASSVLQRALLHPHPTRAHHFLLNDVVDG